MFNQEALVAEMDHLRRFALRLTGNKSDADDLLQSTVLRALENRERFETGTNLFRWSSKIMFNLFVSGYRRRTKFETQFDPDKYMDRQCVAPQQDTLADLENVRRAMERLSPDHREILLLVCVNGMRYEEVSEMLSIPVGTVRSRLSRAREHLQMLIDTPVAVEEMPAALLASTKRASATA
ncbi:MAG TPA: sigma-70 family RNA polymerase sigma factor [Patescibacteria group bacterium]|jgi:RNA polymerase sigma-70 factor (ECF subfamily)|nr:sigma-70 family RNA polymerase sigma factor [Patescibacteria group bacterium]